MKKKIIYLSYDGLLEPLGYSQILSYLNILSSNYEIWIISFEKNNDLKNRNHFDRIKNIINDKNIKWKYLKYNNKSYFGIFKIFDVLKLLYTAYFTIKKNNIKVIHCRSYIPTIIAYIISKFYKINIIFDMRGFWIDERVEWKIWKNKNWKYNFFKKIETKLLINSNYIITLTNVASSYLKDKYSNQKNMKIYTIPTCTDVDLFSVNIKKSDHLNLIHLGAIGTRYDFDKYIDLFLKLKVKKKIKLRIINRNEHDLIERKLKYYEIDFEDYEIISSEYYEVNQYLLTNSIGVFFPIEGFYLKGYYPTKLGEFLSSGIPVFTNTINKDVEDLITKNNVGVINSNKIINDNELNNILSISQQNDISQKCRNLAIDEFSNIKGSKIYDKIYDTIK